MTQGLYLLHIEPAYVHARHYLGWSEDVDRRVAEHLGGAGKASPLVKAALKAGRTVTLARVWEGGDRNFERRLKKHGKSRICPACPGPTRDPRSR